MKSHLGGQFGRRPVRVASARPFIAGAVVAALSLLGPLNILDGSQQGSAQASNSLEAGLNAAGLLPDGSYLSDPTIDPLASSAQGSVPDEVVTLTVAKGDTLMGLLVNAGVTRSEAHAAITAMSKHFRPRDLKIGQSIELSLAAAMANSNDPTLRRLNGLSLTPSVEQRVEVIRGENETFEGQTIDRPLERRFAANRGEIVSSLSSAAQEIGVPIDVLFTAIRAFSFDVDFQRDIQKGDSFEFFYETFHDETGARVKTGKLFYGRMVLSGTPLELYRHDMLDGDWDYFNNAGQSVRKALLRTPIDGARISSGFGKRRHPILGYTKMHKGVDFAAPRGTPIYAAGKGVVEYAGRKGAYGKYVRIRHNSTFKTAYAHLSRYGKNIKGGQRVNQGQIIGYVGTTGRSTGPHLHYEVLKNGKQTNPRKVKLPSGIKLKGKALDRFQIAREEIDRLREEAFNTPLQVALDDR